MDSNMTSSTDLKDNTATPTHTPQLQAFREVVAINEALEDDPEIINSDPYGEGWFFKMKPDNIADYEALLTADEYENEL